MGQGVVRVLRDSLVEVVVLAVGDLILWTEPDRFDVVDNGPLPNLLLDFLCCGAVLDLALLVPGRNLDVLLFHVLNVYL